MGINYILSDHYNSLLTELIKEKPGTDNNSILKKSANIINKINESNLFNIQIDQHSNFYNEVNRAIHEISYIKPGRKLLKRLLASHGDKTIHIREGERHYLDLSEDITVYCSTKFKTYDFRGEKGVKRIVSASEFKVGIGHELVHMMHIYENQEAFETRRRISDDLLDASFDDLEEQLTICGIVKDKNIIDLCENLFLHAWGMDLRIDHRGVGSFNALKLSDYLFGRAYGNVAQEITADPLTIYQLHYTNLAGNLEVPKDLSLLTIAVYGKDEQGIDHLIKLGCDIRINDDVGGPLIAAFMGKQYNLAQQLINSVSKNTSIDREFLFTNLINHLNRIKEESVNKFDDNDFKIIFNLLWGLYNKFPVYNSISFIRTFICQLQYSKSIFIEWYLRRENSEIHAYVGGILEADLLLLVRENGIGIACKTAQFFLAQKLIALAHERCIPLDIDKLLRNLINDNKPNFYSNEYYQTLWELHQKSDKGKIPPFISYACLFPIDCMHLIFYWMSHYSPNSFVEVDFEGNTAAMALAKVFTNLPRRIPRHDFSLMAEMFAAIMITYPQKLEYKNLQGETFMEMFSKIEEDVAKEIIMHVRKILENR